MHTEWIYGVVEKALKDAGLGPEDVEGVAVTAHPGLLGSLLVGLHFAKAFAWARNLPFIAVDHLLAHLYASRLRYRTPDRVSLNRNSAPDFAGVPDSTRDSAILDFGTELHCPDYPFLGLLVSGGHSAICRADDFDDVTVLGTTIDDAVGEAFDKVSKFYGFGYPGGAAIDALAKNGDSGAFAFPMPNLYKKGKDGTDHRYDFSYSGLKTAVVNQLEQFRVKKRSGSGDAEFRDAEFRDAEFRDIAASFQRTAVEILLRGLFRAASDTGITTVVAGGGVAANSCLRARLAEHGELRVIFPPPELCGDNGAMVAGLGERYLLRGDRSPMSQTASARVKAFRKRYP
jgi:N6-L-threonylcarbamoyladenine synthase